MTFAPKAAAVDNIEEERRKRAANAYGLDTGGDAKTFERSDENDRTLITSRR